VDKVVGVEHEIGAVRPELDKVVGVEHEIAAV
jgi:hypothetical protein